MNHCELESGDVVFEEQFRGVQGIKDRYFVIVGNAGGTVIRFTTTTQDHPKRIPVIQSEFCPIMAGESPLPKTCFVDLRHIYQEDDIAYASWLHSGRAKRIGSLSKPLLARLCDAVGTCKSLKPEQKQEVTANLNSAIADRS